MPDFEEQQRIGVWWIWLAVLVPAALMAKVFLGQIVCGQPQGGHPGPDWLVGSLTLFLCLAVPAFLITLKLTVTVSEAGVHIRYYPLVDRTVTFDEIRAFRARRYRPIREFGGWGIRSGLGKKSAYNAKGNLGVELYLHDTRSIMIGSQQHERLAEALRQHGVPDDGSG